MKTILVSLISEQTIPNILGAAYYKPDILWFISTERMEKERKRECIENTLRLKELLTSTENVKKVIVDQDSLADCMNKIEELIEKANGEVEYIVNITGGNKLMALAAYEIFRDIGQKVIIGYMPLGKNEFVQIFPRKKPLKVYEVKERLNLEEYLNCYGFKMQNKNEFSIVKANSLSRKATSRWILDNYELLKGMLGFLYENLKDARGKKRKRYSLSATFDREPLRVEKEMLEKFGFDLKDSIIARDMTKDEIVYLTGGWFEEYVFNEVYSLVEDGVLDDAMIAVKIESLSSAQNELDIAFMKDNVFYYIECKTLGDEGEKSIIRDEVYKKGSLSALLGKGEKRAIICTTRNHIKESLANRARDYGVEVLTIEQVRGLRNILVERFGVGK